MNLISNYLEHYLITSDHSLCSYSIQMLMKNQNNSLIISQTLSMSSVHMIMLLTLHSRQADVHKLLVSLMLKLHQLLSSHKLIKRFIKDMNLLKILDWFSMNFQLKSKSSDKTLKMKKRFGFLKLNQFLTVVQLSFSLKVLQQIQNVALQEHYYKFLKIIMSSSLFTILLMTIIWDSGWDNMEIGQPIHKFLWMENLLVVWILLRSQLLRDNSEIRFQQVQEQRIQRKSTTYWSVRMKTLLLQMLLLLKVKKQRLFWAVRKKSLKIFMFTMWTWTQSCLIT